MGVRRLPDPRMPSPRTAPPVEVNGSAKQPLGMPAADFLRDTWQKNPLLSRNPLPASFPPTNPENSPALASKAPPWPPLFRHVRDPAAWTVAPGPFRGAEFPAPADATGPFWGRA